MIAPSPAGWSVWPIGRFFARTWQRHCRANSSGVASSIREITLAALPATECFLSGRDHGVQVVNVPLGVVTVVQVGPDAGTTAVVKEGAEEGTGTVTTGATAGVRDSTSDAGDACASNTCCSTGGNPNLNCFGSMTERRGASFAIRHSWSSMPAFASSFASRFDEVSAANVSLGATTSKAMAAKESDFMIN
jgi:hypothetical protein